MIGEYETIRGFDDESDQFISEPLPGYQEQKDFTSLVAWRNARKVKLFFYKVIIPKLPKQEKHALISQLQRASISITANIAEGYGRYHYKEGIQFYRISRGSLNELKDHLISCLDLEYISESDKDRGLELIESAKISLNGFIKYVRSKYEDR